MLPFDCRGLYILSSIYFDCFLELQESDRWEWAGSHPQAGAVCVGADHGEAVSWQVASAHSEGDDAGEVPGHKVLKRARD